MTNVYAIKSGELLAVIRNTFDDYELEVEKKIMTMKELENEVCRRVDDYLEENINE